MSRAFEFCYVVRKMPPRAFIKGDPVEYVQTVIQGAVLWTLDKEMAIRISFLGWKQINSHMQYAAKIPLMIERFVE